MNPRSANGEGGSRGRERREGDPAGDKTRAARMSEDGGENVGRNEIYGILTLEYETTRF